MQPLVSIIIPSYNKEKYIEDTIHSIVSQTYTNWEALVIDDLSSDKTFEIAKDFELVDKRIFVFCNEENRGANYSRNFGLHKAKGEYVVFLDADDLLTNNCLENRIKHIENTMLDFCVFTMGTFYSKIGDSSSIWFPKSNNVLSNFLSHNLPWQTMQPIWKKDFYYILGVLMSLFNDYKMWNFTQEFYCKKK